MRVGGLLTEAHPRVSGENLAGLAMFWLVAGSSPRERGKPQGRVNRALDVGLIPA